MLASVAVLLASAAFAAAQRNTTVPHRSADITYEPSAQSWFIYANACFSGGDSHYTNVTGASFTYSFSGTAVYVHGFRDTWSGINTITLDGSEQTVDQFRESQGCAPLFVATDLTDGPHELRITNTAISAQSTRPTVELILDYIEYTTAGASGSSTTRRASATDLVPSTTRGNTNTPPSPETTPGNNGNPFTDPNSGAMSLKPWAGLGIVAAAVAFFA